MKYPILFLMIAYFTCSCNNKETINKPAAPSTVKEVTTVIAGKSYKTTRLGILSPFAMDSANPVNWNIEKEDTTKFFRDYAKTQGTFTLSFSKDSSCSFFDCSQKKNINASYAADNDPKMSSDEMKAGIKIRIHYKDSLEFGATKTAADMTQTYLVRGMNDKELLLETGNSYNDRKLVVWMKAE
jgi:hypothetical protein